MGTMQDTAEPHKQNGSASRKSYLRKAKHIQKRERDWGRTPIKIHTNTEVREGEGGAWGTRGLIAKGEDHDERHAQCSLWRTPNHSNKMFLEGTVNHGEPRLEWIFPEGLQPMEGSCWRRENVWLAERSCYGLSINIPFHILLHYLRGAEEVRGWVGVLPLANVNSSNWQIPNKHLTDWTQQKRSVRYHFAVGLFSPS